MTLATTQCQQLQLSTIYRHSSVTGGTCTNKQGPQFSTQIIPISVGQSAKFRGSPWQNFYM